MPARPRRLPRPLSRPAPPAETAPRSAGLASPLPASLPAGRAPISQFCCLCVRTRTACCVCVRLTEPVASASGGHASVASASGDFASDAGASSSRFYAQPMALRDPLQLPQDEPGCRVRWPQLCCVCVRFVRGCCRCVRNRNSDAARGDGLADTGIGRRREASGARRRGGTVPALGQASAVEPVPRE